MFFLSLLPQAKFEISSRCLNHEQAFQWPAVDLPRGGKAEITDTDYSGTEQTQLTLKEKYLLL